MSLAILFHFLCAQHVLDINISIIRSLRLFCWITTLVALFLVWCVLEFRCGWVGVVSVLQSSSTPTQPHRNSNTHRTKNNATNVVIQQNSHKLLMMAILMSETSWAHKKWNKIASDIKLVFYSSTITMMHGPINIRFNSELSRFSCTTELLHYAVISQLKWIYTNKFIHNISIKTIKNYTFKQSVETTVLVHAFIGNGNTLIKSQPLSARFWCLSSSHVSKH